MSLDLWPALPRLAVDSHPAGSGKGCLMNIISWGNGDVTITDMPACTHPVLSRAATVLNDRICTHRDSDLLCVDCSAVMFGYEPLLVGTEPPEDPVEAKRLAVTLAVALRPHVEPLWRPQNTAVCSAAFHAAQAWLDCPCDTHVEQARTAANAAYAAYTAANAAATAYTAAHTAAPAYAAAHTAAPAYAAANAAATAYTAAHTAAPAYAAAYAAAPAYAAAHAAATAYTAANAAATAYDAAHTAAPAYAAAYAAATAKDPRAVLDTLIDTYYTFTGRPQPAPNPDRLARACAAAGLA